MLALAANGKAKTVRLRPGGFSLRPPAATVTLHLRAANGTYAGAIVVRRKGRRALVGVRTGARLGTIEVREGYATPTRRLREVGRRKPLGAGETRDPDRRRMIGAASTGITPPAAIVTASAPPPISE